MTQLEQQQDETAPSKHCDDLMSINWTLNMRRKCCRFFSSSKLNHQNDINNGDKLPHKSQEERYLVSPDRKVINLDEVYNFVTLNEKTTTSSNSSRRGREQERDVKNDLVFMGDASRNKERYFSQRNGQEEKRYVQRLMQPVEFDSPEKNHQDGQIFAARQVVSSRAGETEEALEAGAAEVDEIICKSDNLSALSASSSLLSQLLNSSLNQLIEIDDGSSGGSNGAYSNSSVGPTSALETTTIRRNIITDSRHINATSCNTYPVSWDKRDYLLFKHHRRNKKTTRSSRHRRSSRHQEGEKEEEEKRYEREASNRQQLSRASISMLDVRQMTSRACTLGGGFNERPTITLDELPSGQYKDNNENLLNGTTFHNHGRHFKQSCRKNESSSQETGGSKALKMAAEAQQQQFVTFDNRKRQEWQLQKANNEQQQRQKSRDLIERNTFIFGDEKQVNHQQRISPESATSKCLAQSKLSELELWKENQQRIEERKLLEQVEKQTPKMECCNNIQENEQELKEEEASQKCPPEARMLINGNQNQIQSQVQAQNESQRENQIQYQLLQQHDSLLEVSQSIQMFQQEPVASDPVLARQFLLADFQCCPFCFQFDANNSMLEHQGSTINADFEVNEHFAAGVTSNLEEAANNLSYQLKQKQQQQGETNNREGKPQKELNTQQRTNPSQASISSLLSSTCSSTSFSSNLQVTTDSASSGHDSPPQQEQQGAGCDTVMGSAPSNMLRNTQAHVASRERDHKQLAVSSYCNQCQLLHDDNNNNNNSSRANELLFDDENNNNIDNQDGKLNQQQSEALDQLLNNTYADIKQQFSSEKSPISYLSDLNSNNNNTLLLPITQIQAKKYNQETTGNENNLPGQPIFNLDPRSLILSSNNQQQQQQQQKVAEQEEEDSDQISMLEAKANLARVVDSSLASSAISSSASSLVGHHPIGMRAENESTRIMSLAKPMPLPRVNTREEPIYDIPSLSIDNSPIDNNLLPTAKSSGKYGSLVMCKQPVDERDGTARQQVTFVRCLSPDQKYPAVREPTVATTTTPTIISRQHERGLRTNLNLVIKTKSANRVSEHKLRDKNEFKSCKCRHCLHAFDIKLAPKEHVRNKFVAAGEIKSGSKDRRGINPEDMSTLSHLSRVAAYGSGDRIIDLNGRQKLDDSTYYSSCGTMTSCCCSTCCSQFESAVKSSTLMRGGSSSTCSTPSTIVYLNNNKKTKHSFEYPVKRKLIFRVLVSSIKVVVVVVFVVIILIFCAQQVVSWPLVSSMVM